MLNKDILLFAGADGAGEQTIGEAGGQGFGVGVYGGDEGDLAAMGLTPMDGCDDPASDNYGNYQHTYGSIMCFVPAFCYRLGNSAAPSYSRDGANALEIRDSSEFAGFVPGGTFNGNADMGDGWILHRAFIDGNIMQPGFFMDKYLCSNGGSGRAVSVKGADWAMCYNNSANSTTKTMGGDGCGYDAITFSRNRGNQYSLTTVYQWSAMAMLSLAHGQAATSASYCAWYDANHTTNFPKGNTNQLKDYNDSSLSFTTHSYGSPFAKTGTCSNFAKSTHNGQNCGIADVAGMCNQLMIGAINPSSASLGLMKTSVKAHDFTESNRVSKSLHDMFSGNGDGERKFGGLYSDSSGINWAKCGVIPNSTSWSNLFGQDSWYEFYGNDAGLKAGLGNSWGITSGVFCRSFLGSYNGGVYNWFNSYFYFGFRASGYAL